MGRGSMADRPSLDLPPAARRWVRLAHVTTSLGLAGAVTAFLVLAIIGLRDGGAAAAAYPAMAMLMWALLLPAAAATLVLGVVQALCSPWGLLRHYWVTFKLVLTLLAIAVMMLQLGIVDRLAGRAAAFAHLAGREQAAMILHAGGGALVLLLAAFLSVFKPKGRTGLSI
jgi:hypothetical protein